MKKFVLAFLTVAAVIGGATASGAFQKPPKAHPMAGMSITQNEVMPGWFITPAQARMW